MQPQNYKSRTSAVRRSARAHLSELRKARMAQRDANADGVPAAPPPAFPDAADMAADSVSQPEGDLLEDIAQRSVTDATPAEAAPVEDAPEPAVEETEAEAAADEPVSDATDEQEEPTMPQPEPPTGTLPDDWSNSPLAALPGAGPGLIWVLGQCGVHSMADLAAKDPAALTAELGVIGQILDVQSWTEFARQSA